jgi:hypothetical protein
LRVAQLAGPVGATFSCSPPAWKKPDVTCLNSRCLVRSVPAGNRPFALPPQQTLPRNRFSERGIHSAGIAHAQNSCGINSALQFATGSRPQCMASGPRALPWNLSLGAPDVPAGSLGPLDIRGGFDRGTGLSPKSLSARRVAGWPRPPHGNLTGDGRWGDGSGEPSARVGPSARYSTSPHPMWLSQLSRAPPSPSRKSSWL